MIDRGAAALLAGGGQRSFRAQRGLGAFQYFDRGRNQRTRHTLIV
ncbi:MAG: hypothetical protein ACT443_04945 [Gemmatimonadota bacterium]